MFFSPHSRWCSRHRIWDTERTACYHWLLLGAAGALGCLLDRKRHIIKPSGRQWQDVQRRLGGGAWISKFAHRVWTVEAEATMKGGATGRRASRARRGFWGKEPGWSFSWGGSVRRGKVPLSPATGRSCGPRKEAAQHLEEAHCWSNGIQRDAIIIINWTQLEIQRFNFVSACHGSWEKIQHFKNGWMDVKINECENWNISTRYDSSLIKIKPDMLINLQHLDQTWANYIAVFDFSCRFKSNFNKELNTESLQDILLLELCLFSTDVKAWCIIPWYSFPPTWWIIRTLHPSAFSQTPLSQILSHHFRIFALVSMWVV